MTDQQDATRGGTLASRTAIVTGGSTGIGLATARSLADRGAHVVIAGRDRERGATAAAELAAGSTGTVTYVEVDVRNAESVAGLVATTVERFGSLDILVNNSGVEAEEGSEGPSEADWDRMFATNAKGTWLCCRAALPHLERTRGVIVNNASMAGLLGVAGGAGYAASKAAVVSLTQSLALAYAERGVRVNAVCAGPVDTQMTYDEWALVGGRDEGLRRALAVSPARRITAPEEVAELICFLASDDAVSITGTAMPIDGGKTAGLMPTERYRW
jgi:NAD(P)-dependent dehydrogenase (short-subunit alcohol dehydrogenase family)